MRSWLATALALAVLAPAAAHADPAPPARAVEPAGYTVKDNALELPGPVVFETGSARLKPESDGVLKHIAGFLAAKAYVSRLRIEVHSDSDGAPDANQTLTEQRALAVARALVGHGVDCKRLIAVGFGGTKPVAANDTPAGKAQNRRTEARIAELRGRAIGGMPIDGGGKVAGDACGK